MVFKTRTVDRPFLLDLLVVDGFSLMSLAATMEPLRAANRVSGRTLYEWRLLSPSGRPAGLLNLTLKLSLPSPRTSSTIAAPRMI